jgi:hypothetical protein
MVVDPAVVRAVADHVARAGMRRGGGHEQAGEYDCCEREDPAH